jgi:hypothetical protein
VTLKHLVSIELHIFLQYIVADKLKIFCDPLQLHVDGDGVDVAEEVAAGRVALVEVLEVAGDGETDHEHHSH